MFTVDNAKLTLTLEKILLAMDMVKFRYLKNNSNDIFTKTIKNKYVRFFLMLSAA